MRHLFLSVCVLILSTALPVMAAQPSVVPKVTAVPTKPKLAAAPDGPRIVEQRGKFVIKPKTQFCMKYIINPRLQKLLNNSLVIGDLASSYVYDRIEKEGQSSAGRVHSLPDEDCAKATSPVINITNFATVNPLGKPYQLELEARQGAGAYVKVVLVRPEGRSPNFKLFFDDSNVLMSDSGEKLMETKGSLPVDAKLLSQFLVDLVFENKGGNK
jgi:hypothetical protein